MAIVKNDRCGLRTWCVINEGQGFDPLLASVPTDGHRFQEGPGGDGLLRSVADEVEQLIDQVQLVRLVLPKFSLQGVQSNLSTLDVLQSAFQLRDL